VLKGDDQPLFWLSGVTRNATERGEEPPMLTSVYKEEVERRPPLTLAEKSKSLLEAIKRRSKHHGHRVLINRESDYFYCLSRSCGLIFNGASCLRDL
jgi:hypothetical protein